MCNNIYVVKTFSRYNKQIMTLQDYIPQGYDKIKIVDNACAFLNEGFAPVANVVLYPRQIVGGVEADFKALSAMMADYFNLEEREVFIKYSEIEQINAFRDTLNDDGLDRALSIILEDMTFLYYAGVKVHLRLLKTYTDNPDTYRFHVDGLDQDFDRYMTCYHAPVTQFIRNDDVIKIAGHDVLYREDAPIYQFKVGDFWKTRVRNKPKNKVVDMICALGRVKERQAFVHRAPYADYPRLMLVGDHRIS